ncbi:MAG TPA: hypothetical protein V6C88_09605 [Chroococcidiopsis sp.]
MLAVIYDAQGKVYGEACRSCVASGSSGIRDRLNDRIHSLQAKLSDLQTLAQEDIQPPTLEEEFQVHRMEAM